ncbi:mucin-17-like isoform X2 [Planococcus citri]|uniref:mucin-17-like isoform X2 n=1 Tax=Planococcus citri TaxID=170843 RepID=UPI0031F9C0F9
MTEIFQMDPFENLKTTKGHLDTCIQVCVQEHLILKDKFEKIQISSSKVCEERETLKANLNSVNERNQGLQKELISANEKNEELQKQLAAFNKKTEELQKQLAAFNKKTEELQKKLSGSQEKNTGLQKELTESGSLLNEALNKNAELETTLNEAKVEIKDVKSKLTLAQNNKMKLDKELHLVRKNLSRVEKEKNKFKSMYETLHKQLQNMVGSLSKHTDSGSEKTASECEEVILSSDDEGVPRPFSNGAQCDDKSILEISKTAAESTPLVIDVRSPQSNSPLSPRRSTRTASRSPVSTDLIVSRDLSKSLVASTSDEVKGNQSSASANQRDTRSTAHHSPISPISTRAFQGANRAASPVSFASVKIPNRPNPTSAAISPKGDARDGSRSPIASILKPSSTPPKAVSVSTDAGNRSSSSLVAEAQSRPIQTSPVFSPRITNVQSRPNLDRRSPLSSILKTAAPLSTEGTHGIDRSASPVSFASRLNQTTAPVSPRKDNRDGRHSPISSSLIISSQNASKAASASTGKDETNRPSTPLIVRFQSKPDQEKNVITPQKVSPVSNTITPEIQSKSVPATTEANKETSPPSPALIRNSPPAVTLVSPRPETRHLLRRSRSPISSIPTTSRDQNNAKPSSTNSVSTVDNKSNAPSTASTQSNQAVTPVPQKTDSRDLRRSPISISFASPQQSKNENVSTNAAGNKQDNRTSSSVITGAQDDRSIATTTPIKDQRGTDPIPSSSSIGSKASGDKNPAVQSGSTPGVRITVEMSSDSKTDSTSKTKKTSPINAGKPSTLPVLPSSLDTGMCSRSPKRNESANDDESRPEELMPLLFPGLLNTPPEKESSGAENINTASSSVFASDDDAESSSTISQSVSSTLSKFSTQFTAAGLEYPKVCLTPIKVSEELLASISRLGKKKKNPSPEEGTSSKKRRKSVPSEPLRKISPRKIKQKIMCFICKKENRCDDGYWTDRELDEHILNCHRYSNYVDLYLRCPYSEGECNRHFRLLKALREHVRMHHQGETLSLHKMERLLSCSNCSLLFTCKTDLNHHVLRKHIGSKKSAKSPSHSFQQNLVAARDRNSWLKDLGKNCYTSHDE